MYLADRSKTIETRDIFSMVNSLGISVLQDCGELPLRKNERAAAYYSKELGYYILLDSKAHKCDKMVSLAHELGHIVLGHFINHIEAERAEFEAEAFAAFFMSLIYAPKLDEKGIVTYE